MDLRGRQPRCHRQPNERGEVDGVIVADVLSDAIERVAVDRVNLPVRGDRLDDADVGDLVIHPQRADVAGLRGGGQDPQMQPHDEPRGGRGKGKAIEEARIQAQGIIGGTHLVLGEKAAPLVADVGLAIAVLEAPLIALDRGAAVGAWGVFGFSDGLQA